MSFFQSFYGRFPVTIGILALNGIIFLLIHMRIIPFPLMLSTPGMWSVGTFLSHFSHLALFHILMNMAVFFQISPLLESRMSKTQYIGVVLMIWLVLIGITFPFMRVPSLGFSGIMMGLIVFTIGMYAHQKAFVKTLFTWLLINIAIGLLPQISLLGHAGGAVAGGLVFGARYLFQMFFRKIFNR